MILGTNRDTAPVLLCHYVCRFCESGGAFLSERFTCVNQCDRTPTCGDFEIPVEHLLVTVHSN